MLCQREPSLFGNPRASLSRKNDMAETLTDTTLPQGAKVIEEEPPEEKGFSFEKDIAGQFVGGLQDITSLIAAPLQRTFGDITVGSEGVSFVSPEEIKQLEMEGKPLPGLTGAEREEPNSIFV